MLSQDGMSSASTLSLSLSLVMWSYTWGEKQRRRVSNQSFCENGAQFINMRREKKKKTHQKQNFWSEKKVEKRAKERKKKFTLRNGGMTKKRNRGKYKVHYYQI